MNTRAKERKIEKLHEASMLVMDEFEYHIIQVDEKNDLVHLSDNETRDEVVISIDDIDLYKPGVQLY
jgi:hypothetical protein